MPRVIAFWRMAPSVRFIALAIFATGVLLLECALRSRSCSFVHSTRLDFFAIPGFSSIQSADYHQNGRVAIGSCLKYQVFDWPRYGQRASGDRHAARLDLDDQPIIGA